MGEEGFTIQPIVAIGAATLKNKHGLEGAPVILTTYFINVQNILH